MLLSFYVSCRREIKAIRERQKAHDLHAAYQDIKADVEKVRLSNDQVNEQEFGGDIVDLAGAHKKS